MDRLEGDREQFWEHEDSESRKRICLSLGNTTADSKLEEKQSSFQDLEQWMQNSEFFAGGYDNASWQRQDEHPQISPDHLLLCSPLLTGNGTSPVESELCSSSEFPATIISSPSYGLRSTHDASTRRPSNQRHSGLLDFNLRTTPANGQLPAAGTFGHAHSGDYPTFAKGSEEVAIPASRSQGDVEYELCYGMIDSGTLRMSNTSTAIVPSNRYEVTLKVQQPMTTVSDPHTHEYLGLLDDTTAKALGRLVGEHTIGFKAFLVGSQSSTTVKGETNQGALRELQIVLYGFEDDSEAIGSTLSDYDIFLQHPLSHDSSIPYRNPQFLVKPGEDFPTFESARYEVEMSHGTESEYQLGRDQVREIFQTASGPETYRQVQRSSLLTTDLKSHQIKALSMMLEKESGSLDNNDFASLWSPTSLSNGRSGYKNCINGLVKENPPLCLGGLLADEMGLGKTLTTIALILGTLAPESPGLKDRDHVFPERPEALSSRTTLIITPKSTLHSWEEQFQKHTKPASIKVCYYYGNKRQSYFPRLLDYDVVITTYGTLTAEHNRKANGAHSKATLLAYQWFRVILDEAHIIRNTTTAQFTAACLLKARHRWCLTGTPIQNKVGDFGSLLQFLKVYPFDSSSCFAHDIGDWIKSGEEEGMKRIRLLVQAVCLRRTKECLSLPPRTNALQYVTLNSEEKELYEVFKGNALAIIDATFNDSSARRSFPAVIQIILRLSQICNHGKDLLPAKSLEWLAQSNSSQGTWSPASLITEVATCGICGREIHDFDSILPCMHLICCDCLRPNNLSSLEAELEGNECPVCAGQLPENPKSHLDGGLAPGSNGDSSHYQPSSKVIALLGNLQNDRRCPSETPIKSVVFSCSTQMLRLIGKALQSNDFRYEQVSGEKTSAQRKRAIETFRNDPGCTVLLASIGSAGVGIDLTVACRVHLMEPLWNPMAEEQALDRIHRIGQLQPVLATRYIVRESIDEYVVSTQKKKLDLIQQSLGPHAPKRAQALKGRLKDLQSFLDPQSRVLS